MVTQIYKILSDIWGPPPPPKKKNWQANTKFSAKFPTTLQLDHKYLQNATRSLQSTNGAANSDHPWTCLLHLVKFAPQVEVENMTVVSTHPKLTFLDAYMSAAIRSDAPWKFHKWWRMIKYLLMHTMPRMIVPQRIFLHVRIRQLAKNSVYFGLCHWGL